jgi:hypothetical protein
VRFVRHPKRPGWGIGRVIAEGADKIEVHFETVGLKHLARSVVALEEVAEETIEESSPVRALMRGRFPADVTDAQLIAFVDGWVALLERRDYAGAHAYAAHHPDEPWTPESMREVIEGYGVARSGQRATVDAAPTDVVPRREVTRWPANAGSEIGEIWYDLGIDGRASDLTATFALVQRVDGGIDVCLHDIHVM